MSEVTIRRTLAEDVPFVMTAERDPGARPYIGNSTTAEHLATIASGNEAHLLVELDGAPAGFAMIASLDDRDGNVELSRLVVAIPGHGIGQRVLPMLVDHAFSTTDAHRFWLDVLPHNARARRVYEASGFVEEGTLREAGVGPNGRESLVIMSVLRAEWARSTGRS